MNRSELDGCLLIQFVNGSFFFWNKWIFFCYEFRHKRCSFFIQFNSIKCHQMVFFVKNINSTMNRIYSPNAQCSHKYVRFVWSFYSHVSTARYITQRAWNAPCINLDAMKCRNVVGYKWNWKVISICAYAFHSRHHFLFHFY